MCLVFDEAISQTDIWQAVRYFQEKRGEVVQSPRLPLGFLSIADRGSVHSDAGKLRVSLYKALLFKEVALHLKAGTLNVVSSYEYRSFEKYLIDKQKWNSQKDSLLTKARLEDRLSAGRFLLGLNRSLNQHYKSVNEGLGANPSVYFDKGGRWHLHRYLSKGGKEADGVSLYPQGKVISVLEVLRQVNDLTGFLDAFQFKALDYSPKRPEDRLLYAAIIGYGRSAAAGEHRDSENGPDLPQSQPRVARSGGDALFLPRTYTPGQRPDSEAQQSVAHHRLVQESVRTGAYG